jgi:hypothetical protein
MVRVLRVNLLFDVKSIEFFKQIFEKDQFLLFSYDRGIFFNITALFRPMNRRKDLYDEKITVINRKDREYGKKLKKC